LFSYYLLKNTTSVSWSGSQTKYWDAALYILLLWLLQDAWNNPISLIYTQAEYIDDEENASKRKKKKPSNNKIILSFCCF
jgi:hypothetical protein